MDKTMLAQCLGSAAVRAGHSVVFTRVDALFKELLQACADHTLDKTFRRFIAPELLLLDDFGLQRLTAQQNQDLYELVMDRHRRSSFIVTSNRGVDEWLALFDDPILGNSALDRLANAAPGGHRGLQAIANVLHPNDRSDPVGYPLASYPPSHRWTTGGDQPGLQVLISDTRSCVSSLLLLFDRLEQLDGFVRWVRAEPDQQACGGYAEIYGLTQERQV